MIQIDMEMPRTCDECNMCIVDFDYDNHRGTSYAFCSVLERFIAEGYQGKHAVEKAILERQDWCPLIDCEGDLNCSTM